MLERMRVLVYGVGAAADREVGTQAFAERPAPLARRGRAAPTAAAQIDRKTMACFGTQPSAA